MPTERPGPTDEEGCGFPCDCKHDPNRREFLAASASTLVGLGVASSLTSSPTAVRAATGKRPGLDAWLATLFDAGETRVYTGDALQHIGFPLGGIGAGTVGLTGRGHLDHWEIFNNFNQHASLPNAFFAVWARAEGRPAQARMLNVGGQHDQDGVASIRFSGEYPFVWLEYEQEDLPVEVALTAYTPFIPLNAKESGLPAAIFEFTLRNRADRRVDAALAMSLPNAIGWDGYRPVHGNEYEEYGGNYGTVSRETDRTTLTLAAEQGRRDRFAQSVRLVLDADALHFLMRLTENLRVERHRFGEGAGPKPGDDATSVVWIDGVPADAGNVDAMLRETMAALDAGRTVVLCGAADHILHRLPLPEQVTGKERVFEDFEGEKLEGWTVRGERFKPGPATGKIRWQQPVRGWRGKHFINTFNPDDGPQGKLVSKPFTIELPYIHLLVGGGHKPGVTCVNLKVGQAVVATATGKDREVLRPVTWDVSAHKGKQAVIEIVDAHSGSWGHILCDHIVFSSSPATTAADAVLVKRIRSLLPVTYAVAEMVDGAADLRASDDRLLAGIVGSAPPHRRVHLGSMRLRDGASVLLRDGDDQPVIIEGSAGNGRVILCLARVQDLFRGRDAKTLVGNLLSHATGVAYIPSTGWWPTAPGNGSISITALDGDATALPGYETVEEFWRDFAADGKLAGPDRSTPTAPGSTRNGALAVSATLEPGASRKLTFVMSWHFPNRYRTPQYGWAPGPYNYAHRLGNMYNNWFASSGEVADYVVKNLPRLYETSKRFHDTFYDSTLPRYLLDAVTANLAILRSQVTIWIEDGTYAGFEGADHCCPMNCTHVYNYAQTTGFLFPELERRVREVDLLVQQRADGSIPHRTVLPLSEPRLWGAIGGPHDHALDGMFGTVLKTYREYRNHGDRAWLAKVWPRVEKLMTYLTRTFDRQGDGVIRGPQPNTYDIHTYGSNTFVGTLYIASLRAAAEMADDMDEKGRASAYRQHADLASENYDAVCWKDAYYVNVYDAPDAKPDTYEAHNCWGPGCHADQLLGQWWAAVLDLGDLLPRDHIATACRSMFRYLWRADLSGFQHKQRVFAQGTEKGLLNCAWPKGGRPAKPIRYCDEVWTGIEYAVAALLTREGMVREALQIVRGARDRYTGNQRNPWAEVECGNFYARALSGYSLLLTAGGVAYHAAKKTLAFRPRYQPEACKLFFTAATGWGTLEQKRTADTQTDTVTVRHGQVQLSQLDLELPNEKPVKATVRRGNDTIDAQIKQDGAGLTLRFKEAVTLGAEESLNVQVRT